MNCRRQRSPRVDVGALRSVLALCLLAIAIAIPADAEDQLPVLPGTVTKIVDGDTIDVQLSSGPIRVRLHGVDTPERGQPWGKESTAALTALVMGKEVDIEPFSQDRYERMIGIVFLGDLNVNLELVKRGHAWAYRQYMRKEDSALCINEAAARTAKKGLWALQGSAGGAVGVAAQEDTRSTYRLLAGNGCTLHCGYWKVVGAIGVGGRTCH